MARTTTRALTIFCNQSNKRPPTIQTIGGPFYRKEQQHGKERQEKGRHPDTEKPDPDQRRNRHRNAVRHQRDRRRSVCYR